MNDDLTIDRFRCFECGYRGEAVMNITEQSHGDGAIESVYEPACHKCGSPHVTEIEEYA